MHKVCDDKDCEFYDFCLDEEIEKDSHSCWITKNSRMQKTCPFCNTGE